MKTKKITVLLACTVLGILMVACDLLNLDKITTKELTAEEAKVEIRAANQEIISNKTDLLNASGVNSISYLYELSTGSSLKSAHTSRSVLTKRVTLSNILNIYRKNLNLKSTNLEENENYGIFEFNFETKEFDLVEESNSVMEMRYPADETAYANYKLNAVLTISNLEFSKIYSESEEYNWETENYETVQTTEEVPISADVLLKIDGKEEMSANYSAGYTEDGFPTSMKMGAKTDDNSMEMKFSGSNVDYTTTFSEKLNNELIMGYDINITYTSNMEDVDKVTGYYTITPLKFEGTVQAKSIQDLTDQADENDTQVDVDLLNTYIDVDVIQTEQKAKIGTLQYKMYTDEENYKSAQLAIVYADGTYEWLNDVLTVTE